MTTAFIQTDVFEMMLQEGVIEESTSPWRAQVLIIVNEHQRKTLVVDYSLTNRSPEFTLILQFNGK